MNSNELVSNKKNLFLCIKSENNDGINSIKNEYGEEVVLKSILS